MRFLRRAAAFAVVGVLCLGVGSPPAQAAAPSSGKVKLLPATKRIGGLTGSELLGEQWHQWLELPPENNSFLLNGDLCMSAGRKGKILMGVHSPFEPTVCTVKPGTPVFFSTYSSECSTVEPPPFFGATEADQQACAIEALASFIPDAILVSVDGADPVDIIAPEFLGVSSQRTALIPADSILDTDEVDIPAGEATFSAAGYVVSLRPLPPGRHEITVQYVTGSNVVTQRLIADVVPGPRSG
jgi:hypothetical protein